MILTIIFIILSLKVNFRDAENKKMISTFYYCLNKCHLNIRGTFLECTINNWHYTDGPVIEENRHCLKFVTHMRIIDLETPEASTEHLTDLEILEIGYFRAQKKKWENINGRTKREKKYASRMRFINDLPSLKGIFIYSIDETVLSTLKINKNIDFIVEGIKNDHDFSLKEILLIQYRQEQNKSILIDFRNKPISHLIVNAESTVTYKQEHSNSTLAIIEYQNNKLNWSKLGLSKNLKFIYLAGGEHSAIYINWKELQKQFAHLKLIFNFNYQLNWYHEIIIINNNNADICRAQSLTLKCFKDTNQKSMRDCELDDEYCVKLKYVLLLIFVSVHITIIIFAILHIRKR